jgi:hypothetical protein
MNLMFNRGVAKIEWGTFFFVANSWKQCLWRWCSLVSLIVAMKDSVKWDFCISSIFISPLFFFMLQEDVSFHLAVCFCCWFPRPCSRIFYLFLQTTGAVQDSVAMLHTSDRRFDVVFSKLRISLTTSIFIYLRDP